MNMHQKRNNLIHRNSVYLFINARINKDNGSHLSNGFTLATSNLGIWSDFSVVPPECHDITEILLKVSFNLSKMKINDGAYVESRKRERRLRKIEKLVSGPNLLYLANKI